MPNIIISAHGGRWSNQQRNLQVPQHSSVAYYVMDGGMLSNANGYTILGHLQNGQEPGGTVTEQINAGGMTYDYSCWYAPEFAADCGIFQVGSTAPLNTLQNYTASHPLLLSQIFHTYPNCTIYWVCCREVTAVHMLLNSAGAFLNTHILSQQGTS